MNRRLEITLATLLLLLSFGLQVSSVPFKSPTYDEQGHISRGYAFVRLGDLHILMGTPVGLNALNALPLLTLPDVKLPVDHPSWAGVNFHPISEQFMWRANDNADQIVFLARLPTMGLTLLLAVFVYRWSRALFGPWGGMISLLLCALDPNLLAHGRLATTDLGTTAMTLIVCYWAWRMLTQPSWKHTALCGIFFGLAQATKFSALLLGPIFALLFTWRALVPDPFNLPLGRKRTIPPNHTWWRRWLGLALAGVVVLAIAYLTLWAVYGFQVGVFPGTQIQVLAPAHFAQFMDLFGRLAGESDRQTTAFLLGDLYVGGRWAYFPVVLLLKTPLPTLLSWGAAVVAALWALRTAQGRRHLFQECYALWLPPLVFFLSSLTSNLNLGYRYVLPVLPFALVSAGRVGQMLNGAIVGFRADKQIRDRDIMAATGRRWARLGNRSYRKIYALVAVLLVAWSLWSGISIWPHYLAYFNELAGGPDNGWRYLVDSNIDWGQDLKGLKEWMNAQGVEKVKLGYIGEARPEYYGIDFDPLPCSPDRYEHALHHDLYYADPAPGVYAVSANLIQGRNLADPESYRWFREHEPIDKIGYSIFIYDVPVRGSPPITLGLSDLVPNDIPPQDFAQLGTNNVQTMWFDERYALLAPRHDLVMVLAGEVNVPPALAHLWPKDAPRLTTVGRDGRTLHFIDNTSANLFDLYLSRGAPYPAWQLDTPTFSSGDPNQHGAILSLPVSFEVVEILGYEASHTVLAPGETLILTTHWLIATRNEQPLKLFVHLLDANGQYRAGQDRLDVWYENWQPGDRFAQIHEITLPADLADGVYQIEAGWYRPKTMQRLPVMVDEQAITDRILLPSLRVAHSEAAP